MVRKPFQHLIKPSNNANFPILPCFTSRTIVHFRAHTHTIRIHIPDQPNGCFSSAKGAIKRHTDNGPVCEDVARGAEGGQRNDWTRFQFQNCRELETNSSPAAASVHVKTPSARGNAAITSWWHLLDVPRLITPSTSIDCVWRRETMKKRVCEREAKNRQIKSSEVRAKATLANRSYRHRWCCCSFSRMHTPFFCCCCRMMSSGRGYTTEKSNGWRWNILPLVLNMVNGVDKEFSMNILQQRYWAPPSGPRTSFRGRGIEAQCNKRNWSVREEGGGGNFACPEHIFEGRKQTYWMLLLDWFLSFFLLGCFCFTSH